MPDPIEYNVGAVDLAARFKRTTTVVASPTDATETIIASLTIADDVQLTRGAILVGWAAFTVGTNGVSERLRIKATNAAGATKVDTGVLTAGVAAAALDARTLIGFDAAPVLPGQVYVLTLAVGSASAGSAVSAVFLGAILI